MRLIKLLTLNTHSLLEKNYHEKRKEFVDAICQEKPEIIALQEVNQTCCKAIIPENRRTNFFPCDSSTVIREDNHVYHVVKMLREKGIHYYWTWLGLKLGYGKYEEGIALMSLSPIRETDVLPVSSVDDYRNWKTRKIIGIQTKEYPGEWFYCVHYGWWDDAEEPFQSQWERTASHMKQHKTVWLMGDFNNPAEVRKEGYDMITAFGWKDSYLLARHKDNGITVEKVIDGWKEKTDNADGMRIDQIWCNKEVVVKKSMVLFNNNNRKVISDHYGVMIEFERN